FVWPVLRSGRVMASADAWLGAGGWAAPDGGGLVGGRLFGRTWVGCVVAGLCWLWSCWPGAAPGWGFGSPLDDEVACGGFFTSTYRPSVVAGDGVERGGRGVHSLALAAASRWNLAARVAQDTYANLPWRCTRHTAATWIRRRWPSAARIRPRQASA